MTPRARIFATFAGLALALTPTFHTSASTITYDFTVTGTSGPLNGVKENGTFSYDSSSIIPGGQNAATGLFTKLSFSWDGIAYDQTTANTSSLSFLPSGGLSVALFGTNCDSFGCLVSGGTNEWAGRLIVGQSNGNFFYSLPAEDTVWFGTVAGTLVPEMSTWTLALIGFAALGYAGYARSKTRRLAAA